MILLTKQPQDFHLILVVYKNLHTSTHEHIDAFIHIHTKPIFKWYKAFCEASVDP